MWSGGATQEETPCEGQGFHVVPPGADSPPQGSSTRASRLPPSPQQTVPALYQCLKHCAHDPTKPGRRLVACPCDEPPNGLLGENLTGARVGAGS